jgi:hypothetical protein
MALFIRQNESQTKLQSKVAADLQDRLKNKADVTAEKPEAAILDEQHKTRGAGVLIAVLLLVAIGIAVWLITRA